MIRYAKYKRGDKINATTYCASKSGAWLIISGKVLFDAGGRELIIKPDKESIFGKEKQFIVYKDRIF